MTLPQDPADPQSSETSAAADATPVPPAPTQRPRPAYGEYAPEGWSWQPPAEAGGEVSVQDPAAASAAPAEVPAPQYGANTPGVPAAAQAGAQPRPGSPTIPATVAGVPHNLGVGQQRAGTPQHFAAEKGAPTVVQPGQAVPPQESGLPQKSRGGDRVVTILLLAVAAIGALQFAAGFMTLPQSFAIVADAFKMTDWTAPASLSTIGSVGTIVMLALFAVTLILSVQRMRRRKLAFFIPLIGGVVAFIAMFIIISIAMTQTPELFGDMTPERLQQLMDALGQPLP